ncbi:hypothetical protein EVG20_g9219 [Dentipellis fragilis]|uniref:Uncharacterized protein n=1 Tax=Dentipellis fragilis TaxID=205917 RepID=A0A4Y9Y2T3_9AGAM|nr:hypothetical protein EVG20_g9219 [Dentipellis fragilis]
MSTRFRSSIPQWSEEARTEHAAEVHATLSARIDSLSRQNAALQEDLAAERTKQAAFGPALLATVTTLRRRHARAWASVSNILEESEEHGADPDVRVSKKQSKEREEGRKRRQRDVDSLLFASCRDVLDLEMVLRDFCDDQLEIGSLAVRNSDAGLEVPSIVATAALSVSEIPMERHDLNDSHSQDDGTPCSDPGCSHSTSECGACLEDDSIFPPEFEIPEEFLEEPESRRKCADWEKREPPWNDQDLWNSNKHAKIRKAEQGTKVRRPRNRKPKTKRGRSRAYSIDE